MEWADIGILAGRHFAGRGLVIETIEHLKRNPGVFEDLLGELDMAIDTYNAYRNGLNIKVPAGVVLKNAEKIKIGWNFDLPGVDELLKGFDGDDLEKAFEKFADFEFIGTMKPVEKLAAAGVVAAYRTYLLVIRPELEQKGIQVASTLEEMLAVLAINGRKTKLFVAVKPWIESYKEEDFDISLAEAIRLL